MVYAKDGEAIIFDTPSSSEAAEQLLHWVETELKCTVKAVVVNHFHVDCLGSLDVFHQQEIPSFANQQTIDLAIAAEEPAVPQMAIKEGANLLVGGHQVINRHFGAGHTQDNIVSYLPEEKVLFGGCMIKTVGASKGNLADADVVAWPETVAKVKEAFPKVKWVIPGHGQAGGVELLEYTQLLFGAGN
jgi:metallo-beta-lactamase class B